jgi:hypothetical protein
VSRRQVILLGTILLVASGLAFFLQDMMARLLILPLSYLWWVLNLIYRSIAQLIFWGLLVVLVAWMALGSLYGRWPGKRLPREKGKPRRGPVETAAQQIHRSQWGTYYKWLMARRLGKLALEILHQLQGEQASLPDTDLGGQDWRPSPAIQAYLEAGLNRSFADYPRRAWSSSRASTPFDQDIQSVVDFLESQMRSTRNAFATHARVESSSDRRRS